MMNRGDRAKFRNRKDITIEEFIKLKEKLIGEAKAVGAEQIAIWKIIQVRK